MDAVLSAPTRKRYERYEPSTPLVLTERDRSILADLHDRRFMRTSQLQAIYGNSIAGRLRLLYLHGYIDQPKAQKHWRLREGGGSCPAIHALTNRGARAISIAPYQLRPNATRRDWNELNRNLSELSSHIPHETGVADIYVWFRRICTMHPRLALVQGCELDHEKNGRALDIPGEEKTLESDLTAALVPSNGRGEGALFFSERHTGSEPNTRYSQPNLEHLTGKYEGYLAYAHSKKYIEQFGMTNFRVLTVTSGGEINMENIASAAYDVCGGAGVGRFLVTSATALQAAHDPLDVVWLDASGEEVRLGV